MSLVGVAASDTTNYLDNDGTSGLLYSVRAMTTSSFPDMYAGSFLSEPQAASGGTPAGGGTPVIPHVRMRHVDIQY